MRRLIPILTLAAAACASPSRGVRFGDRVLPKEGPCQPRVYEAGERPAQFLVLGRVEAESTADKASLRPRLEKDACRMGADALVDLSVETFDTVRSEFDQQTRESKLERGPKIHAAQALAVLVQDATVVKAAASAPAAPAPACAPCPSCPSPAKASAPAPIVTGKVEGKSEANPEKKLDPQAVKALMADEPPPPPPPPLD